MRVRDIMTKSLACCTPDTGLQHVAKMMLDCDCGAIPIVESKERMVPMGVVTDRDIVCRLVAAGQCPLDCRAEDCMSSPAITIHREASLEECLELMEDRKVRRILVVDDIGMCCGIVAQADIADKAPDFETGEMVREISEHYAHA
jgi:predicted transcriptional regulator